jgi:large repetitive protein
VLTGQKLTYTIRVKNTGTLPANQVEVTADLPAQIKALQTAGPANGVIDGAHVTFSSIASIAPNQTAIFTIEAQAVSEGDGRFSAQVKSLSLNSPLRSDETTRVISRNDSVRH